MAKRVAIVMAAGKGTRMKSGLPKVLVEVCERPMIDFVLDALREAGVDRILVVVGYRSELVRQHLAGSTDIEFVEQTEQLGTGHAVMVCRDQLNEHDGVVVVVTGDSPLTQSSSIRALIEAYEQNNPACILGTTHTEDPTGLGRIVRNGEGGFEKIVEEKDASDEQKGISEVNMSTYAFDCRELLVSLDQLSTNNSQREYYITDAPGILKSDMKSVLALDVLKPCEALSINTVEQIEAAEVELRKTLS